MPWIQNFEAAEARSTLGASSFRSVADLWHHRIESTPESEAIRYYQQGHWHTLIWRDVGQKVRDLANGLLSLGLQSEQRVSLWSSTRVEWVLCDIAVLCAAGATTTIYPATTDEDCCFILNDSDSVFIIVETLEQAQRLEQQRALLPNLRHVFVMEMELANDDEWIQPLEKLTVAGQVFAKHSPQRYEQVWTAIGPEQLATLIYTSGTTGRAKGVLLTHDSWVYEAEAIDALALLTPADHQFLFLPLAHVFAKVLEILFIRLGIPTVIDHDTDHLLSKLQETRPSWLAAVPRVFEKATLKLKQAPKTRSRAERMLYRWGMDIGQKVSHRRQQRLPIGGFLLAEYELAKRLVFRPIHKQFGGRVRFFISGGAPLSKTIAEYFHACDLLILEGYGLTETAAATCVNTPNDYIFGTVGRPLPGTEIKIAEDGEILVRGRGVMKGYHKLPEETAACFTADGWLKTGDIGKLLPSGHLQITDRKKDLIITSGGKNIAPAPLESRLINECPYISNAFVYGDRKPFCVALITVEQDAILDWAKEQHIPHTDFADLLTRPQTKSLIRQSVDELNRSLPAFEAIREFTILPNEFSVENHQLTASLKIRRREIEKQYQQLLDELYHDHPIDDGTAPMR